MAKSKIENGDAFEREVVDWIACRIDELGLKHLAVAELALDRSSAATIWRRIRRGASWTSGTGRLTLGDAYRLLAALGEDPGAALFRVAIKIEDMPNEVQGLAAEELCGGDQGATNGLDRKLVELFEKTRKQKKLTQQQLADLVWPGNRGNPALMRWRRICGIKRGKPQQLKTGDIEAICTVLGLEMATTMTFLSCDH